MKNKYVLLVICIICCVSCKKYLDEKPNIALAIPTTLKDFQALLETPALTSSPGVIDLGADDYYFYTYSSYLSKDAPQRNSYVWKSDIWEGISPSDWSAVYGNIYTCNVVLEGLQNFNSTNDQTTWNSIFGSALFFRALQHYNLEEVFGQPYKPATANTDLGVVLKLSTKVADKATRSSVSSVFNQITSDLQQASELLPSTSQFRNRPTKVSAYGLLARVYLTMQNYNKAKEFSDKALQINNGLFDFSTLSAASTNPFSAFAPPNDGVEVLFAMDAQNYAVLRLPTAVIDSNLLKSYDANDLRKDIYFRFFPSQNTYFFKGNYNGNSFTTFSGPTVDEMYLIRAETAARLGDKNGAMTDLNNLLRTRWKKISGTTTYIDQFATDAGDALSKILKERRKELCFRALRWSDLRRLNQDPKFAITLTRVLNGQTYTLPPNDPRYTYPIPDAEIRLSNLVQNPR